MKLTCSPLQQRQIVVFVVGWLAYASSYCLRKPLGVVKTDLETELGLSKTQLGWLDTALLLPYAIMQMLLGPLGDKFGARKTYGVCLLLSALSMISFGSWNSFYMFVLLLFLNGTFQKTLATIDYQAAMGALRCLLTTLVLTFQPVVYRILTAQCWPNCMKALGLWYPDSVRNSVFGVFGTCAFAGGIIGTSLAVWLQTTYGWRSAFLTPSAVVAVMGVLVLLFFQQPDELSIEVPGKEQSTGTKSSSDVSWLQLLKIPMLAEVAIALFCLKSVRYCMYMWLPMYLLNQLQYGKAQAGMFSTMFEVGGVLGSAMIGFVLDRWFRGRPLVGTALSALLSGLSLLAFTLTGTWGVAFNSLCLFLAGAFNCGPDTILGFGSVGTFLEGPIVGVVATAYGWSGMFYLMIGMTFLGTFAVFRASVIRSRQEVHQLPDEIPLVVEVSS